MTREVSQKKKTRTAGFVALAFVCLVLIGGYAFVVTKTRNEYAHIKSVQEELLLQIQLERRVRDTAGALAELADERARAQTYFKTPDDVISIIEEVEDLESAVGIPVSVVQVHVEGEDSDTREGVLVVNVFAEGAWRSVAHLLSLLDALPYQATFSQVTLDTSGVGEEGGTPVWSLRGALRITLKQKP